MNDEKKNGDRFEQDAGERDLRYGEAFGTQRDRSSKGEDDYLDPETVTIDWSASPVTGATAYKIYGRTNSGPWGLLGTVAAPGTSFVDTGAVTPGVAAPTTTDHVGFSSHHDGVARTAVPKATTTKSTDAYFFRY